MRNLLTEERINQELIWWGRMLVQIGAMREDYIGHIFGPDKSPVFDHDHIRAEATADLFATDVMLRATIAAMEIKDVEPFVPLDFYREHLLTTIAIHLIEQCRKMGLALAADKVLHPAWSAELVMQGALTQLRRMPSRQLLIETLIHIWSDDPEPSEHDIKAVFDGVAAVEQELAPSFERIQAGLREASKVVGKVRRDGPSRDAVRALQDRLLDLDEDDREDLTHFAQLAELSGAGGLLTGILALQALQARGLANGAGITGAAAIDALIRSTLRTDNS